MGGLGVESKPWRAAMGKVLHDLKVLATSTFRNLNPNLMLLSDSAQRSSVSHCLKVHCTTSDQRACLRLMGVFEYICSALGSLAQPSRMCFYIISV